MNYVSRLDSALNSRVIYPAACFSLHFDGQWYLRIIMSKLNLISQSCFYHRFPCIHFSQCILTPPPSLVISFIEVCLESHAFSPLPPLIKGTMISVLNQTFDPQTESHLSPCLEITG